LLYFTIESRTYILIEFKGFITNLALLGSLIYNIITSLLGLISNIKITYNYGFLILSDISSTLYKVRVLNYSGIKLKVK
jgi:hypothetical protein